MGTIFMPRAHMAAAAAAAAAYRVAQPAVAHSVGWF